MIKEITPLTTGDCFTIFERRKKDFDFPLHYHEEMELNFISNASGARRVVGDHIEEIGDIELVLIGSNLPHVWETHKLNGKEIHEVTIQFHKDLFDEKFLRRHQLRVIRDMLEKAKCGILFSGDTAKAIGPRLIRLNKQHGFDSVLELMSILHDLSTSRNMRTLSDSTFSQAEFSYTSRRIEKVMEYINLNFDKPVSLSEVAKIANMTEVSFSRFFKNRTGASFIDSLIEIRLGHVIDTSETISEVAYNCGFNNISNFNRIFKKKKGCTPTEFRDNLSGHRIFV
ncbi:AraC family transcriptional regulator [Pedobacter nanyangensis]|uniref:AraC family transcriptional regulator n=1 Tax=Pedobacter nanyangensis TaxID=1562389 RepID=UPI000DE2AFF5|nr:AraC family transcriptional regulator [Pedobacter nanyangensis]